jgi:hypothetical protein
MQIYEVLTKQHHEIAEIFRKIKSLPKTEKKKTAELFEKLKIELTSHLKAEQEVFYKPLRVLSKDAEGRRLSWEGDEEHHIICLLLNELMRTELLSEEWNAKMKILHEIVDMHVREEEGEIFFEARKAFDREEAEQIAQNMIELQEIYRTMVDRALEEDVEIFNHPMSGRDAEERLLRE